MQILHRYYNIIDNIIDINIIDIDIIDITTLETLSGILLIKFAPPP